MSFSGVGPLVGVEEVLGGNRAEGWLAFNGDEVGVAVRRAEGDPGVSGRRNGELRWEGRLREEAVLKGSGRAWHS